MKYNNKKTEIEGIIFDSGMESKYYLYLRQQLEAGFIRELWLQPTYELLPSFTKYKHTIRKIIYKADFLVTFSDGSQQVIDVKGVETDVFRLKRKLFDYHFPDLELKIITEYPKNSGKWIALSDKPKSKKGQRAKRSGTNAKKRVRH